MSLLIEGKLRKFCFRQWRGRGNVEHERAVTIPDSWGEEPSARATDAFEHFLSWELYIT